MYSPRSILPSHEGQKDRTTALLLSLAVHPPHPHLHPHPMLLLLALATVVEVV
jgi:hypothetical protein